MGSISSTTGYILVDTQQVNDDSKTYISGLSIAVTAELLADETPSVLLRKRGLDRCDNCIWGGHAEDFRFILRTIESLQYSVPLRAENSKVVKECNSCRLLRDIVRGTVSAANENVENVAVHATITEDAYIIELPSQKFVWNIFTPLNLVGTPFEGCGIPTYNLTSFSHTSPQ